MPVTVPDAPEGVITGLMMWLPITDTYLQCQLIPQFSNASTCMLVLLYLFTNAMRAEGLFS